MLSSTIESKLSLRAVTRWNVQIVRELNGILFPINYAESFYATLASPSDGHRVARIVYYGDVPIGMLYFRQEDARPADPEAAHNGLLEGRQCYLISLGIVATYRQLGIGTGTQSDLLLGSWMLAWCEDYCRQHWPLVDRISLHVQTSNGRAVAFYRNRGFGQREVVDEYYSKVACRSAFLLQKMLH